MEAEKPTFIGTPKVGRVEIDRSILIALNALFYLLASLILCKSVVISEFFLHLSPLSLFFHYVNVCFVSRFQTQAFFTIRAMYRSTVQHISFWIG